MGSITYKPGPEDPQETRVYGKSFKAGEPVEVNDPLALSKAQNNRFFEVSGLKEQEPRQMEVVGGFQDANSGDEVQLVRRPRLPAYGTPDAGLTGPVPPTPATQGSTALIAAQQTGPNVRDVFAETYGAPMTEHASGEYEGAPQYKGPVGTEGQAKRGPGRPPNKPKE